MKKLKHNKYKNTGLLLAILSRSAINEALNKKPPTSLGIIKKFFSNGTELAKELKLYNLVQEINVKATYPESVLDLIAEKRSKTIDAVKLDKEKYSLIGVIKKTYDLDTLLENRVYNYKTFASIYKLFEYAPLDNPVEYTEAKRYIIENIESKPIITETTSVNEPSMDVKRLAFKIAVEKFNQKYNKFNESQKSLLRRYILESSNPSTLKDYMVSEASKLKKSLVKASKNIDNTITRIKLNECVNLLDVIVSSKDTKPEHFSSLLKYYELKDELYNGSN